MSGGFIPPHGHYKTLLSYQKAEVIYDITFHFCRRFLSKPDRTIDQMIQAARSGKQNIVEGSAASGTSTEMEIRLMGRRPRESGGASAGLPGLPGLPPRARSRAVAKGFEGGALCAQPS